MKRIMLTEDDSVLNELISSVLEMSGMKVVRATSKATCLEKLPIDVPDYFIFDLSLPDANGTELAQLTSEHYNLKLEDLNVVFISAVEQTDLPENVANIVNQHKFMRKPFELKELVAVCLG